MKAKIRIFRIFFRIGFLKLSKYIEASLVNIISAFIFIFVQYFVWKAIMKNAASFDYTFYQMFSYIIYAQVIGNFYPNMLGKQMGALIKSGDISFALMKPLSITKQLIFENMGVSAYKALFISLPVLMIGCIISRFHLCFMQAGVFFASMLLSYFIFAYVDLIFGMLQFYTTSTWGIGSLKYAIITLLSGQLLPLSIYPVWCQRVISYLPFKHLYDTPLQILIGKKQDGFLTVILIEAAWCLGLYLLFGAVYKRAVKNIVIQGG